jgi:NADPH-dependent 2,4-dienoyl-CoA reductase/sulfur reductase-like enzyme
MAIERLDRRGFLRSAVVGLGAAAALTATRSSAQHVQDPALPAPSGQRVVIVGGGFGGNFTAVTLRRLAPTAEIVVIERNPFFISGPASMEYVFGLASLDDISRGYRPLMAQGIKVVRAEVEGVEPKDNRVFTSAGRVDYTHLVITTGIRLAYEDIAGLRDHPEENTHPYDKSTIVDMRRRLDDYQGGTILLGVPPTPFKCPPGPYEIALLIAEKIKKNNLSGKVLLVDANGAPQPPGVAQGFRDAIAITWADQIEYVTNQKVTAVDVGAKTVTTDKGQSHKYDLLSVIPPNKAATFIREAGLGEVFVEVDPATFRSTKVTNIYAVGDAARTPYTKSAYVASVSGKVVAHTIASALGANPPAPPDVHNICYPYVASDKTLMVRADWSITTEEGKPKVNTKGAADNTPNPTGVQLRRTWERGLWREMFGA